MCNGTQGGRSCKRPVEDEFDDAAIQKILLMETDVYPLCIMPVGRVAG